MKDESKMIEITSKYNNITEVTGFALKNCFNHLDDMGISMIKSYFVKFNSFDDWKKFYDEVKQL